MSPNPEARYNLTELADLAGVTPRTVRYYLSQGLLQAVGTAGPGAKYDDGHLARLQVIRRLQREHQPLAEIRRRLESLDDAQVRAFAEPPSPEPGDSASEYIRRVLSSPATAESPALYATAAPAMPAGLPPIAPTAPAAPASDVSTESRVERSQWERIALTSDVEIHIRRPLPRSTAKRVDRLVSIARDLLEEDPS